MMSKNKKIVPEETEVLIYSKSAGCNIKRVLLSYGKYTGNKNVKLPIKAMVVSYNFADKIYSLGYRGQKKGGDFYLREDFKIIPVFNLNKEDFEL